MKITVNPHAPGGDGPPEEAVHLRMNPGLCGDHAGGAGAKIGVQNGRRSLQFLDHAHGQRS